MEQRLLKRAETSGKIKQYILGRIDDNPKTIKKRLDTYLSETVAMVELLNKSSQVMKINAEGSIKDVFK